MPTVDGLSRTNGDVRWVAAPCVPVSVLRRFGGREQEVGHAEIGARSPVHPARWPAAKGGPPARAAARLEVFWLGFVISAWRPGGVNPER
jgi:hypothetical protein